jgi:lambda repressor-like predicted transcriptional regulator
MVATAPLSSVLISRLEAPGVTRTALARLMGCSRDALRALTSPAGQNGGKIHRETAESYAEGLGLDPKELWP